MRILLALILGIYAISRPDMVPLGGIPLGQITLDMVFGNLWTGLVYAAAWFCLLWSLAEDQVWPWRWRWRSLKDGLHRIVACSGIAFVIWVLHFLNPSG